MTQGQRVMTPDGPGSVCYVRMAPLNYSRPLVVSVLLDSRRADANAGNYSGTIYPVEVVSCEAQDELAVKAELAKDYKEDR